MADVLAKQEIFTVKSCIYNTFRDEDNVTYQVLAYRPLRGEELKKKVSRYVTNLVPQRRPNPGDIVIINTEIGLRAA